MENDIFTALLPTTDHNHTVFNAVSSHIFSGPFIQPGIIDHNIHGQIMAGNPLFSTVQEDHSLNNFYITNHGGMPTGEAPISRTMLHVGNTFVDGSSENNHLGTSLSATSLVNLLSPTTGLRENLLSNDISSTSALPSDMRAFISHPTPRNCGYGPQDGAGYDEPMGFQLPSINTVCPSYHVVGSSLPGWNANNSTLKSDHSKSYHVPRNELSLSLSSCQPSTVRMPNIPDQCSEKSCSVVTQVAPKDTEELSLFCGASSTVHFSRVLLGSRYFHAAQQILAEVANYALENSEEFDDSLSGIEGEARMSFSSSCSSARGFSAVASDEFLPSGEPKSQESEAEKTRLLTMLQMIDHKYNQCLDQIQNVITAFHDSTNSGIPHMHARFTFHTISAIYKNLRERITSQVFLTGQQQKGECIREKEKAFESSVIQKQWALQQLGRKDQQSWRPQRGLPERSVSVLRAWMFQNFLHPYPKDNDKHLLAIKSGLTRSQVSNWFINARVRLWKPMIEEMHSEIMRKHQTEGVEGDCRSHRNIGNQRIRMS